MAPTFMPNTSIDSITENVADNRTFWEVVFATWQWRLKGQIPLYCSPLIVLIGTIGNILTLVVLLRPKMRQQSTFVYLAGLAIADLLVLYTMPFTKWIEAVAGIPVAARSDWLCKSILFFRGVSSHYSVWLIVLITAERLIVVVFPLRAQLLCQRSVSLKAMIALLGFVLVINGHKFWTFGVRGSHCKETEKYEHEARTVWFWVDASMYSLVPFAIIVFLNTLIIAWIKRAGRLRRTVSSQANAGNDGSRRLTVMLLTLSFAFLLTTAPSCIVIIYLNLAMKPGRDVEFMANIYLAMTICKQIMFVNHAINFFLYCLIGKRFRKELASLPLVRRVCL